ncbi:hypothetical protein LSI01_07920 [Furfurilactobacillus siliginis]|uniref:Uncharacterized protein n=1 Tax=Furfurilactobacillus siliginis TaxID=348151 RepID=A0A510VQZ5_9LACO|nr:hypothetical protein LSI01_07920 [Furfurilactobacillus siliginis]
MKPRINTVFITEKDEGVPVLLTQKPSEGTFTIYVHLQYIYFSLDSFTF